MPESPPKKMQRMAFDPCLPPNITCNCTLEIGRLQKHITDVKNTMQQENAVLCGQMQIVVEALADQKVILKQLLRDRAEELPLKMKFPLMNEENLFNINSEINEDNKDSFIKAMRSLLQPAGVLKNIKYILSDQLIKDFNIDGVQGKKCLKNFNKFHGALLESISANESQGSAEYQLRKAIQLSKKRISKNICIAKSKSTA